MINRSVLSSGVLSRVRSLDKMSSRSLQKPLSFSLTHPNTIDEVAHWEHVEGGCLGPWSPGQHGFLGLECLDEKTVLLFSCPRPLLNSAPMVTMHPLCRRMNELALKTQSSSVSVVSDRREQGTVSLGRGALTP